MFQPSLFSMDNFQSHHMPSSKTNINSYPNHVNFADNSNNNNMCNVQHSTPQVPPYSSYQNTMPNTQDSNVLFNGNGNTNPSNVNPYDTLSHQMHLNAFSSEIKPILDLSSITNHHNSFQCRGSTASSTYYNHANNPNNGACNPPSATCTVYPSAHPQIEDTHSNSTTSSNSSYNHTLTDTKSFTACAVAETPACGWDAPQNTSATEYSMNPPRNKPCNEPYSAAAYAHSNYRSNVHNIVPPHATNHCVIHGPNAAPSVSAAAANNTDLNFSIPIRIINAVNNHNNTSPSTASDSNNPPTVAKKQNVKKNELAPHTNIECAVCGAICGTRQILIQHSQHYHKKICGYCGKKFARNSNLKEHIRIHTGFTPYVCSVCHRGFKQQHSLKDHIRTHTGEKPFQCDICAKRFTVKNNLKVHMRVHTGEKPYQCTVCYKRFTQKGSLNTHMRKVHKVSMRLKNSKH